MEAHSRRGCGLSLGLIEQLVGLLPTLSEVADCVTFTVSIYRLCLGLTLPQVFGCPAQSRRWKHD